MNTTHPIQALARHLEALGRLWQARLELVVSSWRAAIERGEGWSVGLPEADDEEWAVRGVERALRRTSRLVPGATCIHRALAARRMLADRGVSASVVIGLRKRSGELEGHAWIEVDCGDDAVQAFLGETDEYVRCG